MERLRTVYKHLFGAEEFWPFKLCVFEGSVTDDCEMALVGLLRFIISFSMYEKMPLRLLGSTSRRTQDKDGQNLLGVLLKLIVSATDGPDHVRCSRSPGVIGWCTKPPARQLQTFWSHELRASKMREHGSVVRDQSFRAFEHFRALQNFAWQVGEELTV